MLSCTVRFSHSSFELMMSSSDMQSDRLFWPRLQAKRSSINTSSPRHQTLPGPRLSTAAPQNAEFWQDL